MVLDEARKRRALLETAKGRPTSYIAFWIAIIVANVFFLLVDDVFIMRYIGIAAVICVAGFALSKIDSRIDALIALLELEKRVEGIEYAEVKKKLS